MLIYVEKCSNKWTIKVVEPVDQLIAYVFLVGSALVDWWLDLWSRAISRSWIAVESRFFRAYRMVMIES